MFQFFSLLPVLKEVAEADIELSNFLADLQELELFMKRFQNP